MAVNGPRSFSANTSFRGEAFVVSAPGKVIVFGEHAVVHGKAAIAAAISLRSYMLVTPLHEASRNITLQFPDVSLDHSWSIDDLPWSAFSPPSKAKRFNERVTALDSELLQAMEPHIETVSPNLPDHVRSVHKQAASAFLYLLLSLGNENMRPCTYALRSTIPIGAGLGSSASICVCISTALLRQNQGLKPPLPDLGESEYEEILETINQWAFVGELCMHGNPSGVDNTVATRGKAVLFKRTGAGKPPQVTPLHDFPVLPLLLVDTKQARSTATEVAKVGSLKKAHSVVTDLLLDAIDKITESAHAMFSQGFNPHDPDSLQYLGELIRMNHGLLVSLGVSHPRLERVREIVDHAGIGWTKLTGAGGGGCAITVLKDGVSTDGLQTLEKRLETEGFAKYETLLGGNGIGILSPATTGGSKEPISLEMFLKPKVSTAVEELVGAGGEGFNGNWMFWCK